MVNPNKGFLDFNQIFQKVYDEDAESLRVLTTAEVVLPDNITVDIDHTEDSIRLGDGTNLLGSTVNDGLRGLNVYVVGSQTEGMKGGIKTHKISITSVPTAIIISPLSNRKALSIRVWVGSVVYFAESGAVGVNGYPKNELEEMVLSASDAGTMTLYAVCDAGETSELRVIELA